MVTATQGSGLEPENPLGNLEDSLSYSPNQASQEQDVQLVSDDRVVYERQKSTRAVVRVSLISLAALLLFVGLVLFLFQRQSSTASLQTGNFNVTHLSLKELAADATTSAQSLKVRGQLEVGASLVLSASGQPKNPVSGQLYFDKDRKQIQYYDGTQFVLLQGGTGSTIQNVQNISNITGDSTVTSIFNSTSSVGISGTVGSLALFATTNTLGDSLIQQSGVNLQIASTSASSVTVGSNQGGSSVTIQGGAGNVSISTGGAAGITGSISITTGDSSTTASGNISIDSGVGVIDGEVVEDKTFESGVDNMQNWFNTSIATTTAQAHSGSQSLEVTPSSAFWGIIEVLPGTTVTSGHQYHFSIWVRASTTPRTIGASIAWEGVGTTTSFTSIIDSTTGWTEMTLTAPAPAGATSVSFRMQSSTGAAGDIHYFDDVTITDLSSSSAASTINLGSTNAKIITIGNLNQIGATTIKGGSGISIQSGAASTTITGGALTMTGNAASSFTTTSGALTLSSAATAVWGINTASSGIGGNLTLRAGQGGSDGNNDGGDLFLQGGAGNGTGLPGSVIIKPPADVADIFQIQNSSGTAFLAADSANKIVGIMGAGASFATLLLSNAHFRSTQTTTPSIATPTNCGTTPTAAVTAGSTDTAGSFSVTTGTGGTASSCDVTITFNAAYNGTPKSILVVGKTDAVSAARQIYVGGSTSSTFSTAFGVSAGGADSTTYSFSYWVIE